MRLPVSHCKCCGNQLRDHEVFDDGLCNGELRRHPLTGTGRNCYRFWTIWVEAHGDANVLMTDMDSPERSVSIDHWLEQGTP